MNILLADDHALFLDGMQLLLQQLGVEKITKTHRFDQVPNLLDQTDYDLLLLDLDIPGLRDIDAIKKLHAKFPCLPIVVLSANEAVYTIEACLQAGVMGYIPKSSKGETMLHAIKLVLTGERYLPTQLLANKTKASEHTQGLSPRQHDVWQLLVSGMSNKEIASTLGITEYTVKQHVSKVLEKFEVHSRTKLIQKSRLLS